MTQLGFLLFLIVASRGCSAGESPCQGPSPPAHLHTAFKEITLCRVASRKETLLSQRWRLWDAQGPPCCWFLASGGIWSLAVRVLLRYDTSWVWFFVSVWSCGDPCKKGVLSSPFPTNMACSNLGNCVVYPVPRECSLYSLLPIRIAMAF